MPSHPSSIGRRPRQYLFFLFFIIVFLICRLYTRDPHQLFELLCIQLRCIAVAYSDGVKKLITTDADGKNPKYNPIQLLDGEFDRAREHSNRV